MRETISAFQFNVSFIFKMGKRVQSVLKGRACQWGVGGGGGQDMHVYHCQQNKFDVAATYVPPELACERLRCVNTLRLCQIYEQLPPSPVHTLDRKTRTFDRFVSFFSVQIGRAIP